MASQIRVKARGFTRASEDAELDAEVWRATLKVRGVKEKENHWISGPFTEEELNIMHPGGWIANRRFGFCQKQKIRVIDDYSASYVNST
eukprot:1786419-Amphidinium_carterae.1